jgi:hypothetical protein
VQRAEEKRNKSQKRGWEKDYLYYSVDGVVGEAQYME